MFYTYILRCKDDTYYIGYTTDIKRRIKEHEKGINSKYTRARGIKQLEIYWISKSKSEAMKLECLLKKLTRANKSKIIENPKFLYEKYGVSEKDYVIG